MPVSGKYFIEKLLLTQAELDSVQVTDNQVESSMNQRFRYYISQFGSQQKLEEFYQKPILEIKEEIRSLVKDQLMAEQVQSKNHGKYQNHAIGNKSFL